MPPSKELCRENPEEYDVRRQEECVAGRGGGRVRLRREADSLGGSGVAGEDDDVGAVGRHGPARQAGVAGFDPPLSAASCIN